MVNFLYEKIVMEFESRKRIDKVWILGACEGINVELPRACFKKLEDDILKPNDYLPLIKEIFDVDFDFRGDSRRGIDSGVFFTPQGSDFDKFAYLGHYIEFHNSKVHPSFTIHFGGKNHTLAYNQRNNYFSFVKAVDSLALSKFPEKLKEFRTKKK